MQSCWFGTCQTVGRFDNGGPGLRIPRAIKKGPLRSWSSRVLATRPAGAGVCIGLGSRRRRCPPDELASNRDARALAVWRRRPPAAGRTVTTQSGHERWAPCRTHGETRTRAKSCRRAVRVQARARTAHGARHRATCTLESRPTERAASQGLACTAPGGDRERRGQEPGARVRS